MADGKRSSGKGEKKASAAVKRLSNSILLSSLKKPVEEDGEYRSHFPPHF
jgi:hypothetical protein